MIFNVFQGSHKGVEVPGHDSAWRGPYLREQNVGEAHAVSGLQTRSGECVKTYRSLGTKRMGDMSLFLSSEFFGHMCTCAAEDKFCLHFDWIFFKFPFTNLKMSTFASFS